MWKKVDTSSDKEVLEGIRIMHGMGDSWKAATLGNVRWWISVHKCEGYRYSDKSLDLILGFQWDDTRKCWHVAAAGIAGVAPAKQVTDLFVNKAAEFMKSQNSSELIAVVPKKPEYPFAYALRGEVQRNPRVNWREEFQTPDSICYELKLRG